MQTRQIPTCCGRDMQPNMETPKFVEMNCEVCGDVVYVKKERAEKPQMLDD
ncbi:MAG: hypothetical protein J4400_02520 [Candidatus Aenigmarchaeota archaeon]|nr:hypothetical protein [Candidatus Aenigmarchaeota archaeon]